MQSIRPQLGPVYLQPLQITGNAELRLCSSSTNPHKFLAMVLNRTPAIHTTKTDNVK